MGEQLEPFVMKSNKKAGIGKKIGIFILILIALVMLYPITNVAIKSYNKSKCTDKFYVQQEVLEYLQERYNEEFIVMYNRGMSGAYNYVQLYAYPTTHRDEMHKIEIQGYYNKWGKLDYYDDYVMVKLTEEYEAYIDPIIDEYFDEYKFYMDFNAEWLTNNLPADTKLEDLWELKANQDYPLPKIYLFLSPNNDTSKDNLKCLVNKLSINKVRCSGRVVYYEDIGRYRTLTGNWNNDISASDFDNIVTYLIYDDNNYKFTSKEE